MNDMSSVYSDFQGKGSVIAAQLAVEDYSAKLGVPVEIVAADHQNKPDVGAAIARKWFDEDHVDVIMDLPNSAVALAVLSVATEKNKAVIGSGAGSSVMTGPKCSKDFVHWTYDTYEVGNAMGRAVTAAAARPGSSSPPTTRSARICATIARMRSRPRAARSLATRAIRSTPPTSPASCCRRKPPAPTSSPSPTPAAISTMR